jgi:hypothetical protein
MQPLTNTALEICIRDTERVVRRSLVPGSVLSPLLASWFIAKWVRDSIGDMDLSCQSWVDDLMIGGR